MKKLLFLLILLTILSCNPDKPNPLIPAEVKLCKDIEGKCEETGRVCDDRVGQAVCTCEGNTVWGVHDQKCVDGVCKYRK